jgi:hypothetical protein
MDKLISFSTAFLAKRKGFNQPCYDYYFKEELQERFIAQYPNVGTEAVVYLSDFVDTYNLNLNKFAAPTQSHLQKWLREEYKCFVEVQYISHNDDDTPLTGFKYVAFVNYFKVSSFNENYNPESIDDYISSEFDTYEEALENGLFNALKLI